MSKPVEMTSEEGGIIAKYYQQETGNKITGTVILVAALVTLIFGFIVAAGVFGQGEMGYVAGGLVVGSMVLTGLGAYLLVFRHKSPDGYRPLNEEKA